MFYNVMFNVCVMILTPIQGAHWTTDNASNNYSMMEEIEKHYRNRQPPHQPPVSFDSKNTHIFCFPHVVNIITQCILHALDNPVSVTPGGSEPEYNDLPALVDVNSDD